MMSSLMKWMKFVVDGDFDLGGWKSSKRNLKRREKKKRQKKEKGAIRRFKYFRRSRIDLASLASLAKSIRRARLCWVKQMMMTIKFKYLLLNVSRLPS